MSVLSVRPIGALLGAGVTAGLSGGLTGVVGLHRRLHPVAPLPVRPTWRGRGPVVLVGGFCTTETVLEPMRGWLEQLGYQVLVQTTDVGMGCAARSVEALLDRLDEAAEFDRYGQGVRVVGYSRGGQFARVAAQQRPVRALVTLGAPFDLHRMGAAALLPVAAVTAAGALGAKHLAGLQCLFGACCADYRRRVRQPVPGSFTSIYRRQDKVVPWRASIDPAARNVEVSGSHLQLISSPEARRAVARVLRLPACDRRAAA
jgi:pimeloyl-ACP methyl ester carboxylesterase